MVMKPPWLAMGSDRAGPALAAASTAHSMARRGRRPAARTAGAGTKGRSRIDSAGEFIVKSSPGGLVKAGDPGQGPGLSGTEATRPGDAGRRSATRQSDGPQGLRPERRTRPPDGSEGLRPWAVGRRRRAAPAPAHGAPTWAGWHRPLARPATWPRCRQQRANRRGSSRTTSPTGSTTASAPLMRARAAPSDPAHRSPARWRRHAAPNQPGRHGRAASQAR